MKKINNYKLLIFDWDGTLMDSTQAIVKSFQRTADDLKLPRPKREQIKEYIGLNAQDQQELLFPDIDYDAFIISDI